MIFRARSFIIDGIFALSVGLRHVLVLSPHESSEKLQDSVTISLRRERSLQTYVASSFRYLGLTRDVPPSEGQKS